MTKVLPCYLRVALLARHMGRHIPGNPQVIVQNMPGAGGLVAANHLFNNASRDGTVFGTLPSAFIIQQLLGNPAVRFDSAQFTWIGSMTSATGVIFVRHDAPVRTFDEVFRRPVKIGTLGPGSWDYYYPVLLNGLLGTKFEIISGYSGANEADLALERGEVDARWLQWNSLKLRYGGWLSGDRPFIRVLLQMGRNKRPELLTVPLVLEYGDERARRLLEVSLLGLIVARPFVAPPGASNDRSEALRRAFAATLQDERFIQGVSATRTELEDPLTGWEAQSLIERIMQTPEEQIQLLRHYLAN